MAANRLQFVDGERSDNSLRWMLTIDDKSLAEGCDSNQSFISGEIVYDVGSLHAYIRLNNMT